MKHLFTEFFVVVKQLQMDKDTSNNTSKWDYARHATYCATGIFVLTIMTGTPVYIVAGGITIATGRAARSLVTKQNNDRNKSKQIY